VNIDSGSYNNGGVDAVGDRLRAFLDAAGITSEITPNATYGDCMAARLPCSAGGKTGVPTSSRGLFAPFAVNPD
jgi:hypothetical protein